MSSTAGLIYRMSIVPWQSELSCYPPLWGWGGCRGGVVVGVGWGRVAFKDPGDWFSWRKMVMHTCCMIIIDIDLFLQCVSTWKGGGSGVDGVPFTDPVVGKYAMPTFLRERNTEQKKNV